MRRIFVDKLTSIGAVADGDNPDAEILFYKSNPVTTDESGDTNERHTMPDNPTPDKGEGLPENLPEPVVKALDEAQAELEKARAERDAEREQREALAADVAKMRDEQLTERFEKRAAELVAVLGESDEVPSILKELHEAAPEAYAKLDSLVGDAAKIAAESQNLMFKELGTSNDESDPVAKIRNIAKSILENERDQFPTIEKARAEAWARNPELYDEYQKTSRQVS